MAGERVPQEVDPTTPSVARMYDYYLGGKDNFIADREAAERVIAIVPAIREFTRDNRDFLIRVVTHLAEQGIKQFLDIGAGLPTQRNVHEVALEVAPDARIVYVDNDPVVLAHARALLADNPGTIVVQADLRDPGSILDHPEVRAHLDYTRPFAILLLAILHFLPDDEEAAEVVGRLRRALPPGGYLAVSHAVAGTSSSEAVREAKAGQVRAADKVYSATPSGGFTTRPLPRIAAYLDGLDVLEPGLVPVDAWRPEDPGTEPDFTKPGLAGVVARVP
ncbi:SAM-dependent methyltransferase [Streptosporangium roseum]|uniref:S-adenosyl methyltransferase n=1 Tax=Streptosporangium roseum (strain ATCC 12428 / DSM 43021 / JCM 3005 / KCTC 9067 / NCIMB 10171 / NRRL 2505 / NI 9100) TaxID=479432 RepID=D2AW74_STRRD|nr:SAM-dependent methyltransferase [Streptosporangium roseum]ACZ85027.1 hypothetical protein Sros_2042 [Streptosporangium roseum DSM 43021]